MKLNKSEENNYGIYSQGRRQANYSNNYSNNYSYGNGYGSYYYYNKSDETTIEVPECENPEKTKRDESGNLWELRRERHLGFGLVQVQECFGEEISEKEKKSFRLLKSFPKIPGDLWGAWIDLCYKMCGDFKGAGYTYGSNYEVGVSLLRNAGDFTKWKIVLSEQTVSSARVDASLNSCIDIVTGEEYDQFPPAGWVHCGTSHSHNTMDAFFSTTDDSYELTIPGVHIVVGKIDPQNGAYKPLASIAQRGVRKNMDFMKVVDFEASKTSEATYHPKCLDYIKRPVTITYKSLHTYKGKASSNPVKYSNKSTKGNSGSKEKFFKDFSDLQRAKECMEKSDIPEMFREFVLDNIEEILVEGMMHLGKKNKNKIRALGLEFAEAIFREQESLDELTGSQLGFYDTMTTDDSVNDSVNDDPGNLPFDSFYDW